MLECWGVPVLGRGGAAGCGAGCGGTRAAGVGAVLKCVRWTQPGAPHPGPVPLGLHCAAARSCSRALHAGRRARSACTWMWRWPCGSCWSRRGAGRTSPRGASSCRSTTSAPSPGTPGRSCWTSCRWERWAVGRAAGGRATGGQAGGRICCITHDLGVCAALPHAAVVRAAPTCLHHQTAQSCRPLLRAPGPRAPNSFGSSDSGANRAHHARPRRRT